MSVDVPVAGEREFQLRNAPLAKNLQHNSLFDRSSGPALPCLVEPQGVTLGNVLAHIDFVGFVRSCKSHEDLHGTITQ